MDAISAFTFVALWLGEKLRDKFISAIGTKLSDAVFDQAIRTASSALSHPTFGRSSIVYDSLLTAWTETQLLFVQSLLDREEKTSDDPRTLLELAVLRDGLDRRLKDISSAGSIKFPLEALSFDPIEYIAEVTQLGPSSSYNNNYDNASALAIRRLALDDLSNLALQEYYKPSRRVHDAFIFGLQTNRDIALFEMALATQFLNRVRQKEEVFRAYTIEALDDLRAASKDLQYIRTAIETSFRSLTEELSSPTLRTSSLTDSVSQAFRISQSWARPQPEGIPLVRKRASLGFRPTLRVFRSGLYMERPELDTLVYNALRTLLDELSQDLPYFSRIPVVAVAGPSASGKSVALLDAAHRTAPQDPQVPVLYFDAISTFVESKLVLPADVKALVFIDEVAPSDFSDLKLARALQSFLATAPILPIIVTTILDEEYREFCALSADLFSVTRINMPALTTTEQARLAQWYEFELADRLKGSSNITEFLLGIDIRFREQFFTRLESRFARRNGGPLLERLAVLALFGRAAAPTALLANVFPSLTSNDPWFYRAGPGSSDTLYFTTHPKVLSSYLMWKIEKEQIATHWLAYLFHDILRGAYESGNNIYATRLLKSVWLAQYFAAGPLTGIANSLWKELITTCTRQPQNEIAIRVLRNMLIVSVNQHNITKKKAKLFDELNLTAIHAFLSRNLSEIDLAVTHTVALQVSFVYARSENAVALRSHALAGLQDDNIARYAPIALGFILNRRMFDSEVKALCKRMLARSLQRDCNGPLISALLRIDGASDELLGQAEKWLSVHAESANAQSLLLTVTRLGPAIATRFESYAKRMIARPEARQYIHPGFELLLSLPTLDGQALSDARRWVQEFPTSAAVSYILNSILNADQSDLTIEVVANWLAQFGQSSGAPFVVESLAKSSYPDLIVLPIIECWVTRHGQHMGAPHAIEALFLCARTAEAVTPVVLKWLTTHSSHYGAKHIVKLMLSQNTAISLHIEETLVSTVRELPAKSQSFIVSLLAEYGTSDASIELCRQWVRINATDTIVAYAIAALIVRTNNPLFVQELTCRFNTSESGVCRLLLISLRSITEIAALGESHRNLVESFIPAFANIVDQCENQQSLDYQLSVGVNRLNFSSSAVRDVLHRLAAEFARRKLFNFALEVCVNTRFESEKYAALYVGLDRELGTDSLKCAVVLQILRGDALEIDELKLVLDASHQDRRFSYCLELYLSAVRSAYFVLKTLEHVRANKWQVNWSGLTDLCTARERFSTEFVRFMITEFDEGTTTSQLFVFKTLRKAIAKNVKSVLKLASEDEGLFLRWIWPSLMILARTDFQVRSTLFDARGKLPNFLVAKINDLHKKG